METTVVMILFVFLASPIIRTGAQDMPGVAPYKKSDSFAITEDGRKIRVQHGELAAGNFQIVGVNLAANKDALTQAAQSLGKVPIIRTGDAADGNEQACYRSAGESGDTFLIFGRGEVDSSFILSSNSYARKRNHACRVSSKVYRGIATASGLHLGQTQEQVIAILGLPTTRRHSALNHRDFLAYELETRKRSNPLSLTRARQEHPEMDNKEFHENFDFYDLGETILLRFVNDGLTEITVDWVATT